MHATSSHGHFGRTLLRRFLLLSASLTIGTVIWFLLGDSDGLVAEEKLLPAAHAASPPASTVIAHVDGVAITEEDVVIDVASELAKLEDQRRQLLQAALESRIVDQLIQAEAQNRGLAVEHMLALEVDAKLDQVDADVLAAQMDPAEAPDETAALELRRRLRLAAFVQELRDAAAVSVYGEPGL